MQIRRPSAALLTALALFGRSATVTGCGDPSGQDRNDGTTDDSGNTGGSDPADDLPDNSDPADEGGQDDDTTDPD